MKTWSNQLQFAGFALALALPGGVGYRTPASDVLTLVCQP